MQVLNDEEMESSSKIDLKHVLWWMCTKDAYRLGVQITAKLSKEICISLVLGGRPFCTPHKHD
jgi:hypothetical protein